jgi:hypothetical protein
MSAAGTKHVTEKQVVIIVNGRQKEFTGKEISFREVVELAFPNPWTDANTIYTVTYTRGPDPEKPQGTLVDSKSVNVKKDMIFNVTPTNRS